MTSAKHSWGRVIFVGAGPGDPGLITLRGVECLQQADVVLYDYLVNPQILARARIQAEKICLGQHGRSRIWTQSEINDALIDWAQRGKCVVRLKGGDPAIFARMGEEVEAVEKAGILYEIVPGITAALAAGSYAGIPITHRGLASAVALVTGREDADKQDDSLDYAGLAKFPGTLVFYMGVTTASAWSRALIAAGKEADTPVAIVRRCSFPDQRVVRCQLADVAEKIEHTGRLRPPAIVIVGPVAALAPTMSWFEQRPLFGRRILVTRPADQIEQLSHGLLELGAEILHQPAIRITAPSTFEKLDDVLKRLNEFEWVAFSSANGVRFFFDRLLNIGLDLRAMGRLRLAAIGPATAEELKRYFLQADVVPDEFRAESLAADLVRVCRGQRCLLVRASRGREVLAETLQAAGISVEQVVAYESTDIESPDPEIATQLDAGRVDWITVTSSAIAKSLWKMFGEQLRKAKIASISPLTSATLRALGISPAAEAKVYTMQGIVDAILAEEASTS